jgi:hypothetical protein
MRLHFVNYADAKYSRIQDRLNAGAKASGQFDLVQGYWRDWLETTGYYRDHKAVLDMPRGGGYWVWKPYVLLDALTIADEDDLIIYQDCGDEFRSYEGLRSLLVDLMLTRDILLTRGTPGGGGVFCNGDWTKRDCFVLMGCDCKAYWNAPQVEAGIIVVKKTHWAMGFVAEWLQYCSMPQVVTDAENILGEPNLPGFRDHRHDQSILTNLAVKHRVYPICDLGPLIHFNKYAP